MMILPGISVLVAFIQCLKLVSCNFEILIMHTNDMHARFDETDEGSELITDQMKDQATFGGFARLKTALDEARAAAKAENIPSLFLNAGDTFQGTAFFTLLKEKVVAALLPLLGVDVMSLGNHEFDEGTKVLYNYLEKVQIPVVAANLNFKKEPKLKSCKTLTPSVIKDVNGTKIGIIGYLTPETKEISMTQETIFEDEIKSIRAEAEKLKKSGIQIIIAVGHSGFEVDKKIAKEVADVSLVIGGHTNTFLYNPPDKTLSIEKPEDTYPTIVEQTSGKKVPVVTAYAYTKYLGKLWITFDDKGNFVSARPESNPLLIDSKIKKNEHVQKQVTIWRNKINSKMLQVLGETKVYLDGWRASCKILECNLGNLLADSFVDYVAEKYSSTTGWTDAAVGIANSGSIRTSANASKIRGNMTYNEVLTFLPYRNPMSKILIKGSTLKKALEHSVAKYQSKYDKEVPNEFLQVSGLHVTYNMCKPPNKRVVRVEVRCANCSIPKYSLLKSDDTIGVVLIKFLTEGGDGFSMLWKEAIRREDVVGENDELYMTDTDSLARYIQKYKVVYPEVEGRIRILNANMTRPAKL